MALIKCKECGEKVSNKADICPKCGAPFKLRVKGPSGCMMILIIFVAIIALITFVSKMNFDSSTNQNRTPCTTSVE